MDKILIVEDNESFRKMLELNLESAGFSFSSFENAEDAISEFNRDIFSIGVFDLKLPGMDGVELLTKILKIAPDFPVIIITAYGDIETSVWAVKNGAWDFIQKPFDPDILIKKIRVALEEKTYELPKRKIVGDSPGIKKAINLAKRVSPTTTTVLLYGESGTGKEIFARAIHRWSNRKNGPFVALNSAAIPESLLESELFGIEKGTATGVEKRIGKITQADKGTLFLDEIGDMPLVLQSKLLRVIEEKSFQKVGGRESINVDVRIICATNRDLKEMVTNKEFREDLFYRLNVFPIYILPLRDRKEDIEPLIDYFINIYSDNVGKKIDKLTEGAIIKLKENDWKGNIRELENVITRAIILTDDNCISEEHIIFGDFDDEEEKIRSFDLKEMGEKARRETETRIINEALKQTEGNKAKAARLLNISYKTLFNKINEYKLE
jgi:two-component system response regulator AtoC